MASVAGHSDAYTYTYCPVTTRAATLFFRLDAAPGPKATNSYTRAWLHHLDRDQPMP